MKADYVLTCISALSHTFYLEISGKFEVGRSSKSMLSSPKIEAIDKENLLGKQTVLSDHVIDLSSQFPTHEITQISEPQDQRSKLTTPHEMPRAPKIQGNSLTPPSRDEIWSRIQAQLTALKPDEEIPLIKNLPEFDSDKLEHWVNHIYDPKHTRKWLMGELTGVGMRSILYKYNRNNIRLLEEFELERPRVLPENQVYLFPIMEYINNIVEDVSKMKGKTNAELAMIADCAFTFACVCVHNVKGKNVAYIRGKIRPKIEKLWADDALENLDARVILLFSTLSELFTEAAKKEMLIS